MARNRKKQRFRRDSKTADDGLFQSRPIRSGTGRGKLASRRCRRVNTLVNQQLTAARAPLVSLIILVFQVPAHIFQIRARLPRFVHLTLTARSAGRANGRSRRRRIASRPAGTLGRPVRF